MLHRVVCFLLLAVLVVGCSSKKDAPKGDPLPPSVEEDNKGRKVKVFKDTIPPLPGPGGK